MEAQLVYPDALHLVVGTWGVWLTPNPDPAHAFHPEVADLAESAVAVAPISSNNECEAFLVDGSAASGATYRSAIFAHSELFQDGLLVHSTLARLAKIAPLLDGFSPISLAGVGHDPDDDPGFKRCDVLFESELCDVYIEPEWRWWFEEGFGLFPEGSDPLAFGTLYLEPFANELENNYTNEWLEGYAVGWAVKQVGLDTPVAWAEWNDAIGLANIISMVRGNTVETAIVMRTLGSESMVEIAEARAYHEFRRGRLVAQQEWDPEFRLRGRTVTSVIREAAERAGLDYKRIARPRGRAFRTSPPGVGVLCFNIDLSYCCPETGAGANFAEPDAGREVVFANRVDSVAREFFHLYLQEGLATRGLGHAFRVQPSRVHDDFIVVAADRDFFLRNRAAFMVEPSATVTELDPQTGITMGV